MPCKWDVRCLLSRAGDAVIVAGAGRVRVRSACYVDSVVSTINRRSTFFYLDGLRPAESFQRDWCRGGTQNPQLFLVYEFVWGGTLYAA